MELQDSPLLSDKDEIDINDDATNENYSKELTNYIMKLEKTYVLSIPKIQQKFLKVVY